ncbi:MAG TPA: T9SS type A sorting domain-containing protein [bacterium]|jgi:hypothetical protein
MKRMTGILLSLLLCSGALAQPDTLWTKVYGGENTDWAQCMQITEDGGLIVVGSTSSLGLPGGNTWLLKTDANGDTLWTRTYPSSSGSSVRETLDGGYIIAGTEHFGMYTHAYLIKTDGEGDTLWTRSYGDIIPPGFDQSWANAVQQTDDGGFVFAGKISPLLSANQVYLVKTDALGDTLWTRFFGGEGQEGLYDMVVADDGGLVSVGYTTSYGNGLSDVYIIKTDSDGNTVWTRIYGWLGQDQGLALARTNDGGFIIAGYSSLTQSPNYDVYLIRTNPQGDTLWTQRYDGMGSDGGWDVQEVQDGGFIVVGGTNLFPIESADLWAIRTDENGGTLWTKQIGRLNGDRGHSIRQTADGGYIIAGVTNMIDGISDVWLVRLAEDIAAADPPDPIVPSQFALYPAFPNPFNPVTKLKFSLPGATVISLSVFNTQGGLVGVLADGLYSAGYHETSFDGTGLPSGLYLCQLQTSFGRSTVKLMLMK